MKLLLPIIAILYLVFQIVTLEKIEDGKINYNSALTVVIGKTAVTAINNVQNYTSEYRSRLYEEADFKEMTLKEVTKADFKKPILFWIFIKSTSIFLLKISVALGLLMYGTHLLKMLIVDIRLERIKFF